MESRRKKSKSIISSSSNNKSSVRSHQSPYERMNSESRIRSALLPGFLRCNQSEAIPAKIKNIKPESIEEMTKYINQSSPLIPLLHIGKFELKQDDLKSVLSGYITTHIIDTFLTIIKYLNSLECKENKSFKKVLIAKTKFTQRLFSKKTEKPVGLNCDLLVFPVFVGYWTVLTFEVAEYSMSYYDPLNRCTYLKEIRKNFCKYLMKILNKAELKNIVFQKVTPTEVFSEEDASVYMLNTIINLSTSKNNILRKEDLTSFRADLLKLLFRFGKTV